MSTEEHSTSSRGGLSNPPVFSGAASDYQTWKRKMQTHLLSGDVEIAITLGCQDYSALSLRVIQADAAALSGSGAGSQSTIIKLESGPVAVSSSSATKVNNDNLAQERIYKRKSGIAYACIMKALDEQHQLLANEVP